MLIYTNKIFKNPIDIIECFKIEDLPLAFLSLEKHKAKNHYLIGYIRYDLSKSRKDVPLLYFEVFDKYEQFIPQNIEKPVGIYTKPLISKEKYFDAINIIKDKIKNGITYEVNYTYPSEVFTNLEDFELYNHLLKKQKTEYNTFIKNKYETLMSFSPELFFKIENNKIITKPMKGTIKRGFTQEEDTKNKEFLYNDIKNRAENIMIVDLLRNDLSKIAKTGSVKVDELFKIEEYPTVFQMISQISAELEENITLYDIFKAIFPCGSITGAPKLSTMRVIEKTEEFNREIYCGAIGYIDKENTIFSVPIRILQKQNEQQNFICHTGGAIVWDSIAEDEWQETIVKRKFLSTDFQLIETAVDNWDKHIQRMKKSANELNFVWNEEIEKIELKEGLITRVLLYNDGQYTVQYKNINKINSNKINIIGKVNSKNTFLYHKTTIRENKKSDLFDEIRTNERGEITEGTFTNIGILKDNEYYTPPVKCGLLNGTYRQELLNKGWKEKVLYPEDLKNADKIFCFNSVRGLVEVELC